MNNPRMSISAPSECTLSPASPSGHPLDILLQVLLAVACRTCVPLGRRFPAGPEGSIFPPLCIRKEVPLPALRALARTVLGLPIQLRRSSLWTILHLHAMCSRYFRGYKGNLFQTGSWQLDILRWGNMNLMETLCSSLLQSLAVSGSDGLNSQPSWVVGTCLCPESPLHPSTALSSQFK